MLRPCPVKRPQHFKNKRNVAWDDVKTKFKCLNRLNMSQHLSTLLRGVVKRPQHRLSNVETNVVTVLSGLQMLVPLPNDLHLQKLKELRHEWRKIGQFLPFAIRLNLLHPQTILVHVWFIITSLVFLYLSKLLCLGSFQFEGDL